MPKENQVPVVERFVFTSPVTFRYPWLIVPRKKTFDNRTTIRFETDICLPKDHPQYKELMATIVKVYKGAFPGRGVTPEVLKTAVENGNSIIDEQGIENAGDLGLIRDAAVIHAHATDGRPPELHGLKGSRHTDYSTDRDAFKKYIYSGAIGRADLTFTSYVGFGGGVSCYINAALIYEGQGKNVGSSGNRFGSFDEDRKYMGSVSDENPMPETVGDDEIPF